MPAKTLRGRKLIRMVRATQPDGGRPLRRDVPAFECHPVSKVQRSAVPFHRSINVLDLFDRASSVASVKDRRKRAMECKQCGGPMMLETVINPDYG